jgi:hypothetical protein
MDRAGDGTGVRRKKEPIFSDSAPVKLVIDISAAKDIAGRVPKELAELRGGDQI